MINKRSIKKITAALIALGVVVIGFSGTQDDSFVQPLSDAVANHLASDNPQPITLADFTDFEWDRVNVFDDGDCMTDVWRRGIPWLKYSFVETPWRSHHLWVFTHNGIVTRYAEVLSSHQFEPNTIWKIPKMMVNFRSFSKDEAVFNMIRLNDKLNDNKFDYLFPIAEIGAIYSEDSWQGVFQECIERTSFRNSCWSLATEKYP